VELSGKKDPEKKVRGLKKKQGHHFCQNQRKLKKEKVLGGGT